MKTTLLRMVGVAALLATTGCAYLTTYTNAIDTENKSYALDIKQRVVISKNRPGETTTITEGGKITKTEKTGSRVVCAEPSPDALAVIGASASASSTSGTTGDVANITAALAESGAYVGLRTQSIQLLRDAMYRLCEGYASGAIDSDEYSGMQRRFQSTMMGLLAIEQLTRPVVAAQVVLAASAGSSAGASAGDAAVDKTQGRVDTTTTALTTAQAALDTATSAETTAVRNARENRDKRAAAAGKTPPDNQTVNDLDAAHTALAQAETDARNARKDADRKVKAAELAKRDAETALREAKSKVTAAASGSGQIGDMREASAQITESLTKGVQDIVAEINLSYTRDTCMQLLVSMANKGVVEKIEERAKAMAESSDKGKDKDNVSKAFDAALNSCKDALAKEKSTTLTKKQFEESMKALNDKLTALETKK